MHQYCGETQEELPEENGQGMYQETGRRHRLNYSHLLHKQLHDMNDSIKSARDCGWRLGDDVDEKFHYVTHFFLRDVIGVQDFDNRINFP